MAQAANLPHQKGKVL